MPTNEKRHFVFLDGMRGIAALMVGWLHAASFFHLSFAPHHASLAVDFFFVLSGFVIAYAYDGKLKAGMSVRDFAVKRLIRLYPIIFIGVLLGSAVTAALTVAHQNDLTRVLLLGFSALVLFPLGTLLADKPYPVNGPMWSLFFELAANAVYGLSRGRQPRHGALPPLLLAGSALALIAVIHHYHTVEVVGFSGRVSFCLGFVRVCFPFMAGVMIYRYRLFIPGFAHFDWLLAVVLFALLAQPYFRDSWLYDSCCIVLAFPLLISIGTNDSSNVHANRIWKVLGNLSYPFYLIHQPLVRAAGALYERDHRPPLSPTAAMCASLLIAACVAYGVFVLYDRPVRRLLTMARAHERPPRAATPATNS